MVWASMPFLARLGASFAFGTAALARSGGTGSIRSIWPFRKANQRG